MKNRLLTAMLALALVIILLSCNSHMPELKHNDCELWETVPEGANPDFVEDYIYLWDLLENEYPFLSAAERITGKDADEIKAKYYDWLGVTGDDSWMFYNRIVAPCLAEFGGTGHLSAVDNNFYAQIYTLFSTNNSETLVNHSPSESNFEAICTPVAKKFYAPAFELMDSAKEKGESEFLYNYENNIFTMYFPESSAGYIKVSKMNNYSDMDNLEFYALKVFFESLETEGYENCIIDIRGNTGGSDMYWNSGIVDPNVNKDMSYDVYSLVKGDVCRKYINDFGKPRGEKCEDISKLPLESFPKLKMEDILNNQYFYKLNFSIPRPNNGALFTGRFWLLVDENCYSSSESFAIFCKNTGFATIVGENTGGDGAGINPIVFCLPNSGICLRFSAMNGLNMDGSCNEEYGTTPDYLIENGEDALEKCLDVIKSLKSYIGQS